MTLFNKELSLKNSFWEISISIVKVVALDMEEKEISDAHATGFIVQEEKELYLYTCWHVVSGYKPYPNPSIPPNTRDVWPPKRRKLKITLADIQFDTSNYFTAGKSKSITFDLYKETNDGKFLPLWIQGHSKFNNQDLDAVGISVPLYGDFVKIPIGNQFGNLQRIHFIKKVQVSDCNADIGDQVLIGGYPYGFSVNGKTAFPEPIYIKRNIASGNPYFSDGTHAVQFLLDGAGYPAMSGSPVFFIRDGKAVLFGIYTGTIFPDSEILDVENKPNQKNNYGAALGLVTSLTSCLEDFSNFDLSIIYDEKRSGYFVFGDGFDFFAYFTSDDTNSNIFIVCDCVERAGFGQGYAAHIQVSCRSDILSESEVMLAIDQELAKHELFFLKTEEN